MKILYVSQYFPPEMGAPAARVHELSREWVRLGHSVTVLTGFPNHPDGRMPEAYRRQMRRFTMREVVDGVSVVRTALYPAANRGSFGRMLNYVSFFASAVVRGLALERPDVIIGTSPQPLAAAAAWLLSLKFHCKFVFEVRDLWPESLPAVGQTSEQSWLYRAIGALVTVLYRSADLVVPVTDAFIPTIRQYVPDAQLAVVENGVDLERFQPPANRRELRRTLGLDKRFVVSYIGTIGMAHGLETLLDAATILRARLADALVLVAGEGAERERIERLAAERGLTNVKFLGQRPRNDIVDLVGASDACLVLLRQSEVFKTVLPTKMLEFMACGTPTVVAVDGFARRLVIESNSGVYVPNGDAVGLAAAIIDLSRDPGARAWLGGNGREFVRRRFSRRRKAVEYVRALEGLASSVSPSLAHARTAPRSLQRALQTGHAQHQG